MSAPKLIVTQYPLHELILRRWSPRAFADRSVDLGTLARLLEAARWAPSSFNGQPWRFLVARREDQAEFQRLLGCLVEGNQSWVKHAPVLMLAVAKLNFDHDGSLNRHAHYDLGQAAAYLTFQATALGLFVHQMAGIYPDRAKQTCGIPDGYEAMTGIAIGYLGDPNSLPERLRKGELAPSQRKPLDELVFSSRWGEKLKLS